MDQDAREDSAQRIYDQWQQEQGLIRHREFRPDARRAAKTVLATHTLEEILEAITLYAGVLASQNHYWSKSWTLAEFLNRGLDRFLAESAPLERFLRTKDAQQQTGSAPVVHRSHAERVAAAVATFERVEAANGFEAAVEWLESTHKPSLRAAVLEVKKVAA